MNSKLLSPESKPLAKDSIHNKSEFYVYVKNDASILSISIKSFTCKIYEIMRITIQDEISFIVSLVPYIWYKTVCQHLEKAKGNAPRQLHWNLWELETSHLPFFNLEMVTYCFMFLKVHVLILKVKAFKRYQMVTSISIFFVISNLLFSEKRPSRKRPRTSSKFPKDFRYIFQNFSQNLYQIDQIY